MDFVVRFCTNFSFTVSSFNYAFFYERIAVLLYFKITFCFSDVCLSVFLFVCLSVFLFVCLSVCLFFCLSVFLFVCFSVCMSFCYSVCQSDCDSFRLFVFLSIDRLALSLFINNFAPMDSLSLFE